MGDPCWAAATGSNPGEWCPFISIVIPVYNGVGTIQLCLGAIFRSDYPRERFEVIVVDNNSTDNTPEIASQYPVRLVYEREFQGPHAASNTGVREAQGEIVVFTDSDCVPDPEWLRALVEPFADPDVVAVGGRIEAYHPTSRVERFLQQEVQPLKNCIRLSESFPVSLITANAAYRLDALCAVGLFNPNMYTGSEVDLAWRVQWATGKKVVCASDALIYHKFNPSIRKMFHQFRIYGYSEIMLGTLYKDVPGYPRQPKEQVRIMLRQVRALCTYVASLAYRLVTAPLRRKGWDYVLSPALWFVAESGSLFGKIEALWFTRFYRKQFWQEGPKII
jgi:glycosyltransferase involved in cell wall biosynthesis